ncbi:MAG: hypothetical protein IT443_01750 [Phycisphaeraceae bacterium]|nr:hypothetical protein [Phycisphaeraceae bacterium]
MPQQIFEPLAQFGAAGLMGALWLGERMLSRRRDSQLSETHARLMQNRQCLRALVRLVKQNTQAIERFDETQRRFTLLLEQVHEQMRPRSLED